MTAEAKKSFDVITDFLNNHSFEFSSATTVLVGETHSNDVYLAPTVDGTWTLTCDGAGSPGYGAFGVAAGYNQSLSGRLASLNPAMIYRPWGNPDSFLPFDGNVGCNAFPQTFDPPYLPRP